MGASLAIEDAVLLLLWAGDKITKPTFGRLLESYEGWAYRTQIHQYLQRMESRELVASHERAGELVYSLTERGRLAMLGGKDVVARWDRPWDGKWRQVLFDLPAHRKEVRMRLWRWLRLNGFGYLQNSVWVTPDPLAELTESLRDFHDDVESLVVMEAECCAGYSDRAIVSGAWDFEAVNKRYEVHLSTARFGKNELTRARSSPAVLAGWLRQERAAWQAALEIDPLLPRMLWPADYLGEKAWQARQSARRALAHKLLPTPT
jgi:phenylacetic acid degradation operon negative regulatory protein